MRISDWSSDVCSSDLPGTGDDLEVLLPADRLEVRLVGVPALEAANVELHLRHAIEMTAVVVRVERQTGLDRCVEDGLLDRVEVVRDVHVHQAVGPTARGGPPAVRLAPVVHGGDAVPALFGGCQLPLGCEVFTDPANPDAGHARM